VVLNKKCTVLLVKFVCLIFIFEVCLFGSEYCLNLTQGYSQIFRTESTWSGDMKFLQVAVCLLAKTGEGIYSNCH